MCAYLSAPYLRLCAIPRWRRLLRFVLLLMLLRIFLRALAYLIGRGRKHGAG